MHVSLQRVLIVGFVLVMIMRLIMVFTMGIMPQDAYYYFYSEHPAFSYFDHPPGVAAHLWVFTKILGTHVWSLKLADFIIMCCTLWAFHTLARRFLSTTRSLWALCVFGTTLMITDIAIVTTPDVPLLLFWTLSLIALHAALSSTGYWKWVLAGLLSGLAFDSKYTALFLPIALTGYLALSRRDRKYLTSIQFPLYLVAFIAAATPVLLWNMEHEMSSFHFQSGNRISSILEFNIRPWYFAGTVGHQLAMLLPVLLISMVMLVWKYLKRLVSGNYPDANALFLLIFSAPLIVGFLMISWVYWVKINWMLPAYISLGVLVMTGLKSKHMRWQMYSALAAHALLLIQIIWYPVHIKSDDTYWGWGQLSEKVSGLQAQYPNHFVFAKDGYKTTAVLNFYLAPHVYAGNVIGGRGLQYSIIDRDLSHLDGRDALFLDSQNMPSNFNDPYAPPEELSQYFTKIRILPEIVLHSKSGKALRKFYVVECIDYRLLPPEHRVLRAH
jgi:4-amino-4-deoxy-L-arabinose transferase-like glycosyltransferase